MTDTSAAPDIRTLQSLLASVDIPALEHSEELRRQRELVVTDPLMAMDLDRIELQFLERQAERRDVSDEVRDVVARARTEALDRTFARLQETPATNPAALFDLAELRAAFQHEGRLFHAEAVEKEIAARLESVPLETRLQEEAGERYAAIMTDEEDLDLQHRIYLLHANSELMRGLFDRSRDKMYRRMARRLSGTACDRGLYKRLEALLTRRGVVALEATSMIGLLVVFVLLTVEVTTNITEDVVVRQTFLGIDALICAFFILEFLFKLSLAPAKVSWFLRNAATDLLPAIPAVFLFSQHFEVFRVARLLRVISVARYIRFVRPIVSFFRLLLFLIRGLDAVVMRFSPLINRNFVFFEGGTHRGEEPDFEEPRFYVFQALRREHILLDDLHPTEVAATLVVRAKALTHRLRTREVAVPDIVTPVTQSRDITVEVAIERLYHLRPDELSLIMSRPDLLALDRVTRVINAPVIRSMPFVRLFRSLDPGNSPEERVVSLGRRIADQLDRWRGRILFFADLHGIVTGPQILDRVATAMVNASKRPAVRLLMFGFLFSIVRMLLGEHSVLNDVLKRFVATPLVVLGGVCFVILVLGRWLKRLAGEATESLKRTSEAHFINLLELVKARTRDADLVFLARRVFRFEMDSWEAALALGQQVEEASSIQIDFGEEHEYTVPPDAVREDLSRVAFLYMHFLDGAILHESDIKTTEQLLANLSLENIRRHHLNFSRRDLKRVRKLSLAKGTIFSGPFLWFQFITESVALETAKRITEYNRNCLTLQQRAIADAADLAAMNDWVQKRRDRVEGRIIEKLDSPESGALYRTTEFNSMDFLAVNERRDEQIERVFGREILELLRLDRRSMIREIFGTKPLHQLPRSRRSINFYRFFVNRLSRGRVLLAPIFFLGALWWLVKSAVSRTTAIVREISRPESVTASRVSGRAPYRVALRKIHRMKAPGLLEAMHMRACFDPAYCGAPPTWSFGVPMEAVPELVRDMDFLQMRARERSVMEGVAADNRRRVEQLHDYVRDLKIFAGMADEMERKLAERAVTIAYVTDRQGLRSLFQSEKWVDRELARFADPSTRVRGSWLRAGYSWVRRGFAEHPVDGLIRTHLADRHISDRVARNFRRSWQLDVGATRSIVRAWSEVPVGQTPTARAHELAWEFFRSNGEVSRELVALRAVQSLSVLDVRNYRELVFQLGGYAEEGEDPTGAKTLP